MPWLLPLLCLIVLAGFVYLGFWKGLSNPRSGDKHDGDSWYPGDHSGGPSDGHGTSI